VQLQQGRLLEPARELLLYEEVPHESAGVIRTDRSSRWIDGTTHSRLSTSEGIS